MHILAYLLVLRHEGGGAGAGFEGTQQMFTAISRKVVGKTMHATIPKGNMGYDQCTFSGTVAVESTFVAFF